MFAGIRWIMLERPGYGETPPVSMDAIGDWSDLLPPLLEVLQVERFSVVGLSAGAPYAYACAAAQPVEVEQVLIFSGIPFLHAPGVMDNYAETSRAAYDRYANASAQELRAEFSTFCEQTKADARGTDEETSITRSVHGILAHGAAGPAREARLQALSWGFAPADIVCPVHLWHFAQDPTIPFAAAKASAQQLPQGHMHILERAERMPSAETLKAMTTLLS